jgi:hypothetical protein
MMVSVHPSAFLRSPSKLLSLEPDVGFRQGWT